MIPGRAWSIQIYGVAESNFTRKRQQRDIGPTVTLNVSYETMTTVIRLIKYTNTWKLWGDRKVVELLLGQITFVFMFMGQ